MTRVIGQIRPGLPAESWRSLKQQFKEARQRVTNARHLIDLHRQQDSCATASAIAPLPPEPALPEAPPWVPAPKVRADERRHVELRELAREGFQVVFQSKWHVVVGPLHIWTYSGRWMNELTNACGKINSLSMRELVSRELTRRELPGHRVPGPRHDGGPPVKEECSPSAA